MKNLFLQVLIIALKNDSISTIIKLVGQILVLNHEFFLNKEIIVLDLEAYIIISTIGIVILP